MTLVWVMVAVVALMGMASLAIDYGRAQVVKTELQRAVDSAARYGAAGLRVDTATAVANARAAAGDNTVDDGSAINATVQSGRWISGTSTFVPNANPNNAVQVLATRQVPLMFGRLVGRDSVTVTASAVAQMNGQAPNFVGIRSITIQNNASMGYDSSQGAPGAGNSSSKFRMASNGDIILQNNSSFKGELILGPDSSFSGGGPTPAETILSEPMTFPATENPPATPTTGLTVNGIQHVSGGGTKAYTYITLNNGSTLVFDSPTTVYVTGNVTVNTNAAMEPASMIPGDLKIRMTGGPSAVFGGDGSNNITVVGEVYAPDVDFLAKNDADMRGSFIFRTITVKNGLNVAYDINSTMDNFIGAWSKPGLVK
jgi:Flp pilus assembly protein TadG